MNTKSIHIVVSGPDRFQASEALTHSDEAELLELLEAENPVAISDSSEPSDHSAVLFRPQLRFVSEDE